MGCDCALALRDSGARVSVLGLPIGLVCAFTLRGPGARVFVCRYADMGYDCAFALRGSGARVSVCGYADMGKDCALALLGLVLVFIAVFGYGDGQGLRSRSPWFGARVHSCRGAETAPLVCLFS